jgi:hypothetical protein
MSATHAASPRPRSLQLVGGGSCLKPKRQDRPMDVHCSLERGEYDRLNAFLYAVFKRTGRRVSQKSIVATAVGEFLNRNRAWLDAPHDLHAAD